MEDMDFGDDINKIIERLPESRQNLLFSATMSDDVRALASSFSNNKQGIKIFGVRDEYGCNSVLASIKTAGAAWACQSAQVRAIGIRQNPAYPEKNTTLPIRVTGIADAHPHGYSLYPEN